VRVCGDIVIKNQRRVKGQVGIIDLALIPNHLPTPSLPVGLRRGADVHVDVNISSSMSSGRRVLNACRGMSGAHEDRVDIYL
jgi:hypothetical protein